MKRIVISVIVVLAVLLLGVGGLAYWSGQRAEQQYRAELEKLQAENPSLQLAPASYQRGWWTAEATTRLEVRSEEPEPVTFSLKHEIHHGPLPLTWWLRRGFTAEPVQVMVRTTLGREAGTPLADGIAKFFGNREPLEIVSRVGLDGAGTHTISMPPIDVTDAAPLQTLTFAGLQGQFEVTPEGKAVRGELGAPALRLKGQDGTHVRLVNLRLTVDQQSSQFGFMIGDSALSVAEFQVDNPENPQQPILLSGITFSTTASERGEQVGAGLQLAVTKLEAAGELFSDGLFSLSLADLDGRLLAQLRQLSQRQSATGGEAVAEEGLKLVQQLLQRRPQLKLTTQVQATSGGLQATADLTFQDPGEVDWENPQALLQLLAKAGAELTVGRAFLESLFGKTLEDQVRAAAEERSQELSDAQVREQGRTLAQEQLAPLVQARYLLVEGDNYKAQVRLHNGQLLLNDVPIPLGE